MLKPQEQYKTRTNLLLYYNIKERKYDTLSVTYAANMMQVDKDFQSIHQWDMDSMEKQVKICIFSNCVDLTYEELKEFIK